MSYAAGEALILGLLRGMSQFDSGNSSRGNWRVVNSGSSSQYAILRPGRFENDYVSIGAGTAITRWRTVVELWQRWVDDGTTATNLQALMQAVIAHLEQYPRLGDATGFVVEAFVEGGEEMKERWTRDGGPGWAVWEAVVVWEEERAVTVA